jgi:hypothetical protein
MLCLIDRSEHYVLCYSITCFPHEKNVTAKFCPTGTNVGIK